MIQPLPPLRLTGADVLREGTLRPRTLALAEGRITRGPLPGLDMTGYLVLPGIIDLCAEGSDPAAQDKAAAAAGVTTTWLVRRWGWPGGSDAPRSAIAGLARLSAYRLSMRTDLRLHLATEMHCTTDTDLLVETVRRNRIGLVIFENDLDGAPDLSPDSADLAHLGAWAHRRGLDPAAAALLLRQAADRRGQVPRHLCSLAEAFDTMGILYGSRADPDGEARERHAMIGARLALFPACRRAAVAAHAMMCPVILPAAEVRDQGPAARLAAEGLATALASDGRPQTMAAAAFALADRGTLPFARAWALVSEGPARIMRLADRGRLDPGQRADLTLIHRDSRRIEATISRGRLIHAEGEAADRLSRVLPHPWRAAG